MAGRRVNVAMVLLIALHGLLPSSTNAALQDGFYSTSTNCTVDVEAVVRGVVEQHVSRSGDGGSGAGLIRLHFHDCFVKGCDGSVLIDPSPVNPDPEKASPANGGLRGIDVVEEAKRQLEATCPGTVSCADILAFAARDAAYVLSSGAISYDVPSGRRDGLTSDASDASQSLPPPFAQLDDLVRAFASKGFGIDELPMDPSYGADMRSRCPEDAGAEERVEQDQATSGDLDGRYFENVLAGRVPFNSDRALIDDGETRRMVEENAGDQVEWAAKFAAAMRKMSELTGTAEGEIREFCHVTNRG
uniref:Peroxidase n=1 Tax=Aegilops tauschii TaxID=37682 RepID=M8CNC8_AEGTA